MILTMSAISDRAIDRRLAPDRQPMALALRRELDQLVRAHLERRVDQLVVVAGDEAVVLRRGQPHRDLPARRRRDSDARLAPGERGGVHKDAGAVEEGVRVVDVRRAHRQIVGVHAIARDHAGGAAGVDAPGGLVDLAHRQRLAFTRRAGDVLHVPLELAHQIRAGRPHRQLQVDVGTTDGEVGLDTHQVRIALLEIDPIFDAWHRKMNITDRGA